MAQSGAPMPPPPQWSTLPATTSVTIPWSSLVTWGRILGFLLIFLGTIIAVAFASYPSNCLASPPASTCSSFFSQWANAVMWGKILWVLGLFFIGGATGIRLNRRWVGKDASGNEDGAGAVQRHWSNLVVIVLCIVLMAGILFTINICPPIGVSFPGFGAGACP